MLFFRTIRAIAELVQWWCRIYPLRQLHKARKELRKLEDEKEKLDQDPTPGNFIKSKRLLADIQEAQEYFEYLSDTYDQTTSRNNNTDS